MTWLLLRPRAGALSPQARLVGQATETAFARPITAVKGAPPPSVAHRAVLARYTLEVAWEAQATGVFTIGVSAIDSGDGLGVSPFDVTFTGPYDNLTAGFRGARVRRGRSDRQTFVMQGSAQIIVRDPAGLLNPENTSSPIQTLLSSRYQPGRLRGYMPDGTAFPLFYGFLEKIDWQPLRRHSRAGNAILDFKDLLVWLAEARPVIDATGTTTTGQAIGKILDAVGWVDPAGRALAAGDVIPDFSADGTVSALDLINALLEAERGIFYIDGAGVATYVDRLDRQLKAPVASIADDMSGAVPAVDRGLIRNRVRVKRTQNDYVAVATDPTSKTIIGDRDLEQIDTPYLTADSQADALAGHLLAQLVDPVTPLRDLSIDNRTLDQLHQCLARELGDVVIVTAAAADIAGSPYLIEQLEHRISPAAGAHETVWLMSQRKAISPFRIGLSQLVATGAAGDVLVY